MESLSRFFGPRNKRNRTRADRRNLPTVEAVITVAEYRQSYGVAAAIYSRGQLLARDFWIFVAGEVSSPERAWYRGYLLAQALADEIVPGARILIVGPRWQRRAA